MALHEPLDKVEARLFGVLVEKQLTTPDGYPLSMNALVSGANQKSNRDPQMSLDEQTVREALTRLRLHGLVREIHEAGARVVKHAHEGEAVLEVDTKALAVLAELLMRGPQTAGELRQRANRMAALPDQDELRRVLDPLMQRGMVVELPPAAGSRARRYGQTIAPGIHGEQTPAAAPPAAPPRVHEPGSSTITPRVETAAGTPSPGLVGSPQAAPPAPQPAAAPEGISRRAFDDLVQRVDDLERELADLRRRLDGAGLG